MEEIGSPTLFIALVLALLFQGTLFSYVGRALLTVKTESRSTVETTVGVAYLAIGFGSLLGVGTLLLVRWCT